MCGVGARGGGPFADVAGGGQAGGGADCASKAPDVITYSATISEDAEEEHAGAGEQVRTQGPNFPQTKKGQGVKAAERKSNIVEYLLDPADEIGIGGSEQTTPLEVDQSPVGKKNEASQQDIKGKGKEVGTAQRKFISELVLVAVPNEPTLAPQIIDRMLEKGDCEQPTPLESDLLLEGKEDEAARIAIYFKMQTIIDSMVACA